MLAAAALATSTFMSGALGSGVSIASASPTSSVYWGAYNDQAPFTASVMDRFEAEVGKHMSIVRWAQPWKMRGTYQGFQQQAAQRVRDRGSIPMIGWGSWELGKGANQPAFKLANITNGTYDGYITQWAKDAKAWGHPFFLRFDHEMNGTWAFPWAEQLNGNQPGDFVRAWRHVHDIFTRVGANNATWVWCPNISGSRTTPLRQVYPGDNYVDWTCLDGYNFGTDNGNTWQTFGQVFSGVTYGGYNKHDSYKELLALAPSKPIVLAEVASVEHGGSKAAWIKDMLQTQLPTHFPQIKAVVWQNWNASGDPWSIETSPSAQAAFKAAIASNYYSSNEFGSLPNGKIQPLGGSSAGAPPAASSTTLTLQPEADTYTASSASTSASGGTSQTLRVNSAGSDTAYLRFDLSQLAGKTITSATLNLHTSTEAWAGSAATVDVKLVNSTTWSEATMSASTGAPLTSTILGTLVAPTSPNHTYSVNISPAALQSKAGGDVSMALSGRTTDVMIFYSREAGATNAPQLVLTYK
jgi:hypothetical protein